MSETRRVLGRDLRLEIVEEGTDLSLTPTGDLATAVHETNLGQAIVTRLRTRVGELEELGHPTLGSRLYEFVGEPNNPSTREEMKSVITDCLSEEPRIRRIVRVEVNAGEKMSDRVDVDISIVPVGSEVPLNMVIPFYLEVA